MALTEKLSAIGSAIREKTGKTEMLTLDAMPGEIRSIEGGGGGSLPAGVYWKPKNIAMKNGNKKSLVPYHGNLYIFGSKSATDTYLEGVYKYNGSGWDTILSGQNISYPIPGSIRYVEYHGKLHMIGMEDYKLHYTFDGTSIATMNEFPNGASYWALFVQNDKLKFYSVKDGKVYVWNEAADTWSEEANTGKQYSYLSFFTINGAVYAVDSSKVYTYNGSTLTQVATWNAQPSICCSHGDCIYSMKSQSYRPFALVEFNTKTNTVRDVGDLPYSSSYSGYSLFSYEGNLCHYSNYSGSYAGLNALYEVSE